MIEAGGGAGSANGVRVEQRGSVTPGGNGDGVNRLDRGEALRSPQAKRANAIVTGETPVPPKPRRPAASDRPSINGIARTEVLAAIRDLYRMDPTPCDQKQLLILLRSYFGFGALGDRLRTAMKGDINAAVRRGILERRGGNGEYHLLCRSIHDYEPAFLREMFLASLAAGRRSHTWIAQGDAIVGAARHLGFTRTGKVIEQAFRGAIRALLRTGELERDGEFIRKAS